LITKIVLLPPVGCRGLLWLYNVLLQTLPAAYFGRLRPHAKRLFWGDFKPLGFRLLWGQKRTALH